MESDVCHCGLRVPPERLEHLGHAEQPEWHPSVCEDFASNCSTPFQGQVLCMCSCSSLEGSQMAL